MPNQPVFGTLYTLDRFVYRQNSTLLYCTIKEIIILKIACFGVIYVPFSRVITRYNVYFFTREAASLSCYLKESESMKSYLERTRMHCPTVWATEVEIFSTAQMLDTDIFFLQSQGIVTNGCNFNF